MRVAKVILGVETTGVPGRAALQPPRLRSTIAGIACRAAMLPKQAFAKKDQVVIRFVRAAIINCNGADPIRGLAQWSLCGICEGKLFVREKYCEC